MNLIRRSVLGVCVVIALIAAVGLGIASGASMRAAHWVAAWGASIQGLAPATAVVSNSTVRLIARPTASGNSVRIHLQNTFGTVPLAIGAASIAYRNNGAQLVPGTVTALTFDGSPSVTIPAGASADSDAASFVARPWEDVAISLYIPGTATGQISRHNNARVTSYLTAPGAGDHTADGASTAFTTTTVEMYWLSAIDVSSDVEGSVVFLGDSITDGTATTTDGHDRWHDIAFLRLLLGAAGGPTKPFVNEGIGGNRVTVTATQGSPAAVQRLDRDVLSRSGISHVIFFEGTNDLASGLVNADQLIAGMTEVIQRVKAQNLKIVGCTIIPRSNATWTAQMTEYRHQVNDWIRNVAPFDRVLDFDAVMKDPTNPDIMNPILEFGDHIHPNVFGYLKIGQSINLSVFQGSGPN